MFTLLLFSLALHACPIDRAVSSCENSAACEKVALRDFERYRRSEKECGVFPEALPFILNPDQPAKGTVVLVHGMSASPEHMKFIAEELRHAGYRVVAPILEGHGGDNSLLNQASFKKWAADLRFAGDVASRLTQPVYLMGHSTGGVMAAYEGSERPGRYKALVGWDPALNLEGPKGFGVRHACQARLVPGWNFVSDLPGFLQEEGERCSHFEASLKIAREMQAAIRYYCHADDMAPSMNMEFTLSALCALAQATEAMRGERMRRLPPSLALLSQDPKLFKVVSKASLRQVVSAEPENLVIESETRDHRMQPTKCSPTFKSDMKRALAWLQANP